MQLVNKYVGMHPIYRIQLLSFLKVALSYSLGYCSLKVHSQIRNWPSNGGKMKREMKTVETFKIQEFTNNTACKS